MATSFASNVQLGYDPTVRRRKIRGGGVAYEYEVYDRKKETRSWYRTLGQPIFSHQAHKLLGRAIRVWRVRRVSADGKLVQGERERVLKDYWISADSKTEGEIQADIFERAGTAREARGDTSNFRQHFMNILLDAVVEDGIVGAADSYLRQMPSDGCSEFLLQESIDKYATAAHIDSLNTKPTGADAASDLTSPSSRTGTSDYPPDTLPGVVNRVYIKYEPRKHCPLIFEEVGTPLDKIVNHQVLFHCLASAIEGAQCLARSHEYDY